MRRTPLRRLGPELSRLVTALTVPPRTRADLDPLVTVIDESKPSSMANPGADSVRAWAAHSAIVTTSCRTNDTAVQGILQKAPQQQRGARAAGPVEPTLPIVLADLVRRRRGGGHLRDDLEALLVLLPRVRPPFSDPGAAERQQDFKGAFLDFNLDLDLPPVCRPGPFRSTGSGRPLPGLPGCVRRATSTPHTRETRLYRCASHTQPPVLRPAGRAYHDGEASAEGRRRTTSRSTTALTGGAIPDATWTGQGASRARPGSTATCPITPGVSTAWFAARPSQVRLRCRRRPHSTPSHGSTLGRRRRSTRDPTWRTAPNGEDMAADAHAPARELTKQPTAKRCRRSAGRPEEGPLNCASGQGAESAAGKALPDEAKLPMVPRLMTSPTSGRRTLNTPAADDTEELRPPSGRCRRMSAGDGDRHGCGDCFDGPGSMAADFGLPVITPEQQELFLRGRTNSALNLATMDWQHADTDVWRIYRLVDRRTSTTTSASASDPHRRSEEPSK